MVQTCADPGLCPPPPHALPARPSHRSQNLHTKNINKMNTSEATLVLHSDMFSDTSVPKINNTEIQYIHKVSEF